MNDLGKYFLPLFYKNRPFPFWNHYSNLNQDYLYQETYVFREEIENVDKKEIEKNLERVNKESFSAIFLNDFEAHLKKSINDIESNSSINLESNYLFKVIIDKKIWRTIAIAKSENLDMLHNAIQEAFEFDNDHLYAFFPSGKTGVGLSINSPITNNPPFTNEVKLLELNLKKGTKMMYVFDFGDAWEFTIQVEEDNYLEKPISGFKVIESYGEAPEQYPDW